MKLLTDKCLIEFEKWYVKNYQRRTLNEFWGMPDSNKIGTLILYFDSVEIDIAVEPYHTIKSTKYQCGVLYEYNTMNLINNQLESREQAWTQAVERADKIRNEQLNK